MRDKINIEEGIKSLERVLLMMNYDNKKTLSENRTYVLEQQNFDIPEMGITNKDAYDALRRVETMKYQRGYSLPDKKCTKNMYTTTGDLENDINQDKVCFADFTSDNNALYKQFNKNINYIEIVNDQVYSFEKSKNKNPIPFIDTLLKKIPNKVKNPSLSEVYHSLVIIPNIILPFMGPVGMGIAIGLNALDAALYYNEGKYTEATLAMVFGALDLGWLSAELKLLSLGKQEAETIIKAVSNKQINTLSQSQQKLLQDVVKKAPEISEKIGQKMVQEVAGDPTKLKIVKDAISKSKASSGKFGLAQVGSYGATYAGYEGAKYISDKNSPKGMVENTRCGYDNKNQKVIYCNWDTTKEMFGSTGSEEDNKLLAKAIKNGWVPYKTDETGKMISISEIPKEYRTNKYKKEQEQFATKLVDMITTPNEKGEKNEFKLPTYTDEERKLKLDSLDKGLIKFSQEELDNAFEGLE